ncbi:hypothetical protein L226DRAFT_108634 [Lentinus tigrinus ALCF2SS1-7]|uniref:Uncharacterized protein n=1 Tax=Lentinus tigrinus ALCF2SS1-6 TaxID=1328759 RepID=A0A5C2S6W9_9APHY|nr:hypothetical protein L227DRAFT_576601 [Lentinus tigrinus ALCF2SS1-6]RPD73359.1 hypothetical protein L226DRAFT_108634 [Lentinus tigrinus ALCF2SS1-7]
MVVLSSRFTVLTALSSIAAVTILPSSANAAAVAIREPSEAQTSLIARHSRKGSFIDATTTTGDDESNSDDDRQDGSRPHRAKGSKGAARKEHPVVPLPAAMTKHGQKKASGSGEDGDDHAKTSKKHENEARDTWAMDPASRMRSLWVGSRGVSVRQVDTLPPRVDKRHHHHHHDHDPHKVVVTGDDDHVDVHERSLQSATIASRDPDNIDVDGPGDHVHIQNRHDHHDHHDHYDHDHDRVDVTGNHDNVHIHRSPFPHHHHHHHGNDGSDIVVTGEDDDVHVHHRRYSRTPRNGRVPTRRSPIPAPEPHHHHHNHHDKVVVKGDHDHVKVHRRHGRYHAQPAPVVISGNGGNTYKVQPAHSQSPAAVIDNVDVNLKRDDQDQGVPGRIDIMSQDAAAPGGQRIASLVLASPGDPANSNNTNSRAFVLNASNAESSPMYLVRLSSNTTNSSTPSNSSGAADNSTASSPYILTALKTNVFDAETAQLKQYCATFDPKPSAPSSMTVESCGADSSGDVHKSQVFAYEPGTGVIRPMWYASEDDIDDEDGTDDDDGTDGDDGTDDDDLGGGTIGGNSTVAGGGDVDPSTPASNSDASVTSFEQQAFDEEFGDATRRPLARPILTAEALDKAQNVTLLFTPAAPEVKSQASTGQDEDSSALGTTTASASSSSIPFTTSDSSSSPSSVSTGSVASLSGSAVAPSGATDSSVTTATASVGDNTSNASDSTAVPGSTAASSSAIATSTSDSSGTTSAAASDTFNGSNIMALATPTTSPALEVKVYNPYASEPPTTTSSDLATSGTDASMLTATSSSVSSTMTPVSTAPYEWMFRQRSLSDLD